MDAIPTAWSGAACYDYGEGIMTRHLCIVARDNAPLYGFLTIAFRDRPPGADTPDVVPDRRRGDAPPAGDRAAAGPPPRRWPGPPPTRIGGDTPAWWRPCARAATPSLPVPAACPQATRR